MDYFISFWCWTRCQKESLECGRMYIWAGPWNPVTDSLLHLHKTVLLCWQLLAYLGKILDPHLTHTQHNQCNSSHYQFVHYTFKTLSSMYKNRSMNLKNKAYSPIVYRLTKKMFKSYRYNIPHILGEYKCAETKFSTFVLCVHHIFYPRLSWEPLKLHMLSTSP